MTRSLALASLAVNLLACDEQPTDGPQGTLELEASDLLGYRSGDRIEFVPPSRESAFEHQCAFLTSDAVAQIDTAVDSVNLSMQYPLPEDQCGFSDLPDTRFHIPQAEHSPFTCSSLCCDETLMPIALVYSVALNNLTGTFPLNDAREELRFVDPARPCTP